MSRTNLNPRILKIDGGDELVVMTMTDYRRLREAVEDAKDVLTMRAARKADRGKPTYTIDEVRARFGITGRTTKTSRTSRQAARRVPPAAAWQGYSLRNHP